MDYEALERVVAVSARSWNESQVRQWLEFVHLHALVPAFTAYRINGPALLKLTPPQLPALGICNSLIQRKLMRWVKEGFAEFEQHLQLANGQNKENIPPFQRKNTTLRDPAKPRPKRTAFEPAEDDSFVIRSCDGNLAAFCVMKDQTLKIGRAPPNTIRTLEVSVENQHAEIFKLNGKHYLRDLGTEAGTFLKISQPRTLQVRTLVEMGSFLMEVQQVSLELKLLQLSVLHMLSRQTCELTISLQDGCSSFSFGRRKTNHFAFDDEHLSGIHAKIFILHGQFVIEDQHSTNGTWLRLSLPGEASVSYALEECSVFKVGTTITYQCEKQKEAGRMDVEYDDTCASCQREKKNILMVPCRHNTVCLGCAEHLTRCPCCDSPIDEKIKIYI